jgi:hypothetical protein
LDGGGGNWPKVFLRDFTKEKGRGAKSKTIFLTSEKRIFNTCQKSRRGMDKMEEGFSTG